MPVRKKCQCQCLLSDKSHTSTLTGVRPGPACAPADRWLRSLPPHPAPDDPFAARFQLPAHPGMQDRNHNSPDAALESGRPRAQQRSGSCQPGLPGTPPVHRRTAEPGKRTHQARAIFYCQALRSGRGHADRFECTARRALHPFPLQVPPGRGRQHGPATPCCDRTAPDASSRRERGGVATPSGSTMPTETAPRSETGDPGRTRARSRQSSLAPTSPPATPQQSFQPTKPAPVRVPSSRFPLPRGAGVGVGAQSKPQTLHAPSRPRTQLP